MTIPTLSDGATGATDGVAAPPLPEEGSRGPSDRKDAMPAAADPSDLSLVRDDSTTQENWCVDTCD